MREIKFRAWDNVANCMYYAGEESSIFFELASEGITAYDLTEEESSPLYRMEHLKYQQFTGLKDMNNEEIYEGDVLESFDSEYHQILKVYYDDEYARFLMQEINVSGKGQSWYINNGTVQVVGNIYENTGLSEDKQ